jgi:hypothetical protein
MIEASKMLEYSIYFLLPFLAGLTVLFIGIAIHRISLIKKVTKSPFNPTFKGRENEIRRLAMQIRTGQSSAIIGAFGNERDAILGALRDPEQRATLYGDQTDRLIFSPLDVQSDIKKDCSQAQFWEYILEPLKAKIADETDSPLFKAYLFCQENNFSHRYLDKLFVQMKQDNWRLVLLINRFEELLDREFLNDEAFFGSLRSLASSHHPSPLSLVIALNESFKQFYQGVKDLPKGSPYLNFLESGAINLGTLPEKEIDEFLENSDPRFTQADHNFLKESTGGHPYLLQRAITILMDAYNNQEAKPLDSAKVIFLEEAENMLTSLLQFWPKRFCEAFVLVAKNQDVSDDFKGELNELNKQGFVKKQENGQWQVRSSIFADLLSSSKTLQEICQQK